MSERVRVYLLIKGIIALNWLLGKFTLLLAQESVIALATLSKSANIIILDNICYLDDIYDGAENTRGSLSMWRNRISSEDFNAR